MNLTAGSRHEEKLAMEVVVNGRRCRGNSQCVSSPVLFLPQLNQAKWADGALSLVLNGEGDIHCLQYRGERVD